MVVELNHRAATNNRKAACRKLPCLEEKVNTLDEELKASKKLKGKPKINPSTLNSEKKNSKKSGKRPGSDKRSKKLDFVVDSQRIIEPEEKLPDGATFNGYREYDVQEIILAPTQYQVFISRIRHSVGKDNSGKVTQRIPWTLRTHFKVIYSLSTAIFVESLRI